MRILIDLQTLDSEFERSASCRYALAAIQALIRRARSRYEFVLMLSGDLPESVISIRERFRGLLLPEQMRVWSAPEMADGKFSDQGQYHQVATLIREAAIANLAADLILIPAFSPLDTQRLLAPHSGLTPEVPAVSLGAGIAAQSLMKRRGASDQPVESPKVFQSAAVISLSCCASSAPSADGAVKLVPSELSGLPLPSPHWGQYPPGQELRLRFGLDKPFILIVLSPFELETARLLIQSFEALAPMYRDRYQLLWVGSLAGADISALKREVAMYNLAANTCCYAADLCAQTQLALYASSELTLFPVSGCESILGAAEAAAQGAEVLYASEQPLPSSARDLEVSSVRRRVSSALLSDLSRRGLRLSCMAPADASALARAEHRVAEHLVQILDSALLERPASETTLTEPRPEPTDRFPKLAYVSPMPPARSGIADYSAELIPALAHYYDITVIVDESALAASRRLFPDLCLRSEQWLRAHADGFDRVLYQVGNSPFHHYMLALLEEIPGVVVLHDFFIGHLMHWSQSRSEERPWTATLYEAHGYAALRRLSSDPEAAALEYPANLRIFLDALGVIVHSDYAKQLVRHWYGDRLATSVQVVPLPRAPSDAIGREAARAALGIDPETFLVCSFGHIAPLKLSHRLLRAWARSPLASSGRCQLIFVGDADGNDYGQGLRQSIAQSDGGARVRVTGFVSSTAYRQYLAAADIAVQLRAHSRGETSAAALDCLNHAVPLIANAHGSLAELDPGAVWLLPDSFSDAELGQALSALWQTPKRRAAMSHRARAVMEHHAPDRCALRYAESLEYFTQRCAPPIQALIAALAQVKPRIAEPAQQRAIASALADSLPDQRQPTQIFVDVSIIRQHDLRTGIQRVVRSLVSELIQFPPPQCRVEPVYLCDRAGRWLYRAATDWSARLFGIPAEECGLPERPVQFSPGDQLLVLDLTTGLAVEAEKGGVYSRLRALGVNIAFFVYDLLPELLPDCFPPGALSFERWLQTLSRSADVAICISRSVGSDLEQWLHAQPQPSCRNRPRVRWFHLGADLQSSVTSYGYPADADQILSQLRATPSFLMVGTIEPRKGHLQALEAFERLWREGLDVNLVIVGNEGWQHLPDSARRTIPEIIRRLLQHPERGQRLHWLREVSDEYLEDLYGASTCLIAASLGEGFGLPVIEAAQRRLPVIVRDIPVFREVAGGAAHYFRGSSAEALAAAIRDWLGLFERSAHPESTQLRWLTWAESAEQVRQILVEEMQPPSLGGDAAERSSTDRGVA